MSNQQNKKCVYSKNGMDFNNCEDTPVTYCKKCGRFYVLSRDGSREEILVKSFEEKF